MMLMACALTSQIHASVSDRESSALIVGVTGVGFRDLAGIGELSNNNQLDPYASNHNIRWPFNQAYPWRNSLVLQRGPLLSWINMNAPGDLPMAVKKLVEVCGNFHCFPKHE